MTCDRTTRLWDAASGGLLCVLHGHEGEVYEAAWSSDGGKVVTVSRDGTARLWDAATGMEVAVLSGLRPRWETARFACGGGRVVTWNHRCGEARIWDAETGACMGKLDARSCSVSPDGRRLVTASGHENAARIRSVESGIEVATLEGDKTNVIWAEHTADGLHILSRSSDRVVRLWDAGSYRCLVELPQHGARVKRGMFAKLLPDRDRIVTWGGGLRLAWIWDARTGRKLAEIPDGRGYNFPGDDWIVAAHDHGEISTRLWRRIRPEWWWGVFCLWHFWVVVALSVALAFSVWKDVRDFRRARAG
jgi:WD40 repeat protein